jgi:hypothetical protein
MRPVGRAYNINNGERACSVALMRDDNGPDEPAERERERTTLVSAAAAGRICVPAGGQLYIVRECTVCACKLLMVSAF